MRPVDLILLIALGALWGASFLFMRVAAPVIGPVPVAALRVAIAGLFLLAVAVPRGVDLRGRRKWRDFALLGLINTAIPFSLISAAATQLPASLSSVLIATTPVFVAIVGWVWRHERLNGGQILGVIAGLLGVVALVGWTPIVLTTPVWLAIIAVALAACFYGVGSYLSVDVLTRTRGLAVPVGQQVAASVILAPFAVAMHPTRPPTPEAALSVIALGFVTTGVAALIFFRLVAAIGPFRTNIAGYLTPAFGVFWGAVLLGETVSIGTVVGFALILVSALLMSNVAAWRRRAPAPVPEVAPER